MECPACKLINQPAAENCDCGYDFVRGVMPAPVAPPPTAPTPAAPATPSAPDFQTLLWQRTLLLIAVYYLVRWIAPSVLPRGMQDLEWRFVLVICLMPSVIWAGIATGRRNRAALREEAQRRGTTDPKSFQTARLVEQHHDTPLADLPDHKQKSRRLGLGLLTGGLLTMAAGGGCLATASADSFAFFGMTLLMLGTGAATLGAFFCAYVKKLPSRDELAAAVEADRQHRGPGN